MNATRFRTAVLSVIWLGAGCGRHRQPAAVVSELVMANEQHKERILRGVIPGGGLWRWTAPSFAFSLDPPPGAGPTYLEMDFTVPEENPGVTLVSKVNGVEMARRNYQKAERSLLAVKLPPEALKRLPAEVEFAVDHSFDNPAKGLIVVSVGLKEYHETAEFRNWRSRGKPTRIS